LNLHEVIQTGLHNALMWIQELGPLGVLVYMLVYILATILFIPGSLLTLGGGAIYGPVWGSLYVFIAATLGAASAFLIGRYLTRQWVNQQVAGNPRFQAIADAVAQEGFKIVLLTRLSPVFPFNLLNYAFGITQVAFKDYLLGSIGMLPGTVLYVYLGSLAGDLATIGMRQPLSPEAEKAQWIVRLLGLGATIAVTIFITRIARNALRQSVAVGETTDATISDE
jgi:uncharacterized membrane protein YdjX (TVP38/TMEM64 family)